MELSKQGKYRGPVEGGRWKVEGGRAQGRVVKNKEGEMRMEK